MAKIQKSNNLSVSKVDRKDTVISHDEKNPFSLTGKLTDEEAERIASNYKRIGTDYYLDTKIPTAKGEWAKVLKKWRKTTIKDDYGPKVLDKIPKFYDFTLSPDNTENYNRIVNGCYNIYEPIQHKPNAGDFLNTEKFLSHIFGPYIEIGLDYLAIMYTKPTEKLPALCLVSKEQKTGKSTFLHWLCRIYGDNSVILGNEDFGSNFNTSWASKLIIGIDESFIDKRVIKEKIKRLVTDDTILAENKGVDKVRRDFIGKFILLSNNEENFIQMEKEDNRFFVLKIPTVTEEDPFLEEKLIDEIPAFLHYLENRELRHEKRSRLWFKPEDYTTDALKAVVKSSKTIIEKSMIETLSDHMENIKSMDEYKDITTIKITPKRLAEKIKDDVRYPGGLHIKIKEIFKDWGLTPSEHSSRYRYPVFTDVINPIDGTEERILKFKSETGKYYTITFEFIETIQF